ncbi:MAG: sulfurtransferase [Acidimicrobiia bacterium]|nr:sulfurtransferase [Acidimicrobiia bacterium]
MNQPAGTGLPGPLVSGTWLQENLHQVVVADVRWYLDGRSGRAAYETGHIPGAVFLNLDEGLSAAPTRSGGRHPLPDPEVFAAALGAAGIADGCQVVAYDDAGGMVAGRLWWMLRSLGEPAAVLDGGLAAWPGPLSTAVPEPVRAHFTPRAWPPEPFVTIDEVDELRRNAGTVVLDARSAERYRGEPNAIDPRFGHVPGAVSAPCAANLRADGTLQSPAALREMYAELGVDGETGVVAYCGSGVSANLDLLALEVAGLGPGRLFVGSWSAWGTDEDRPVAAGPEPG